MSLAFVINNFRDNSFKSGGEKVFYELLKRASDNGHNTHLFCVQYNGKTNQEFFNEKTPITYLKAKSKDFKNPEKVEKLYKKLQNQLKENHFDHIISENITPPIGVSFIQGHSALKYSQIIKNPISKFIFKIKKSSLIKYQNKWLNQNNNQIIVPSNILKNELLENFKLDKNNIHVLYPCIDLPKTEINIDFNDVINKNREIVFGISALNFTYKGGYTFIKALHILKKQGYSFKAKILNDKYYKKNTNIKLIWLINKYKLQRNIEFLPRQNDMKNFYESIDCLIMPSLIETFGLVALEAMSFKRPCITSSVSGASEILKEGENGFVFNSDKNASENLAEKMKILIETPTLLKNLSSNSYQTAKKMNWNDFYMEFTNIILKNK